MNSSHCPSPENPGSVSSEPATTDRIEPGGTIGGSWNRRGFLITVARGLSLGLFLPPAGRISEILAADVPPETSINTYIRIRNDGTITLRFGGCEMGQGAMSGLIQILAEELGVEWHQIAVEQADADATISYLTGGSSAIRRRYLPLRTAGATARELLVAAAMLRTGDADRSRYTARAAAVTYVHPRTLLPTTWSYGELATEAASPEAQALLPDPVPLTAAGEFRLIGKRLPRVDIPLKTDGSAQFGIDVFLPGMVFAVIKHCPAIGGTLARTPSRPSGALAVVPCSAYETRGAVTKGAYDAVAVVADTTWTAWKLAKRLRVSWRSPAAPADVDSASLKQRAADLLENGTPLVAEALATDPLVVDVPRQVASAMAGAARVVEAEFSVPYLAHATMEVLNCTVKIDFAGSSPSRCEVWAPNQAALWVQSTAAALTGLTADRIVVHTTFLGGGLGRKIEQDYVSQAIQVALAVRRPVKLTWMREEDFSHDQYRPMALVRARVGLDAQKNVVAWWYRSVSSSILGQRGWIGPGTVDSQAVEGSIHLPYRRGAALVEWVPLPAGIPVGFWRSVGNSIHGFAVESLIDMLAQEAGMDPFDFRYRLIDHARVRKVLEAADGMSSWRRSLSAGRSWGLALVESFGAIVCQVIEVSLASGGGVRLHRVACAVDCGTVINPDSVEAQMEGGIIHGLNAALWGEIQFKQGVAAQTNFNRSRMLRLNDAPEIEVRIVPSSEPPGGVGEPGVPPAGPALANAYSRLTGRRVTRLPLFPANTAV